MSRFSRLPRLAGALAALALAALSASCGDAPTQPGHTTPVTPALGHLGVYAQSDALAPSGTLVVQVSGPDIVKSDGVTPDTLAFNIQMSNGVASGSITVPAGPQRVIMVRAFDGLTETHRGSVTTDIVAGANPTVTITLVPLVGDVTISVSIGTTIVIVRPGVATLGVGDTLRMSAEIHDQNGALVSGQVRWATLNPGRASVDTLGLVTMRDTGSVQIVATYGTVGGSATLSGTPRTSSIAYQLVWNGSVNRNWSEPNNWTPAGIGAARVPSATDSVVIRAGPANQPWIDACADQSVRDLVVERNASLDTYCGYGVNVYRRVDARGTVTARVIARPGAALAGVMNYLYVWGDTVTLADSVRANTIEVNAANAGLLLRGHRLNAVNALNVYNGTITMVNGDTLEASGGISWQGSDETGLLNGGVLLFHGTDFYGYRYRAGGTNRVVFDRAVAGTQSISGFDYYSAPTRAGLQRWDIRSRDGVRICGHVAVNDSITISSPGTSSLIDNASCGGYYVRAYGPVVTAANTNVASYLWELRDVTGTSLVAGGWSPTYTDIYAAGATLNPALAYQTLRLYAGGALTGRTSVASALVVDGGSTELALNGHHLSVGGNVDFYNGAVLTMTNAADSLAVAGNLSFNTDTRALELTHITAGLIEVGGVFNGYGFNAAGTNLVRLTAAQAGTDYLSGLNYLSYDHAFQDLELASGAVIGNCGHTRVRGTLTLRAGATLQQYCGGYYVRVDGNLVTEAGSTFKPYNVQLYNSTGTQNVAGAFTPDNTSIYTPLAPGQLKPGLGYSNVGIYAAVSLPANLTINGDLTVATPAASLALNGHRLDVLGRLNVNDNAILSMSNAADSLVLNGSTSWSGAGNHNGKLTAGVLIMRGDTFCASNFYASGTHRTVFDRSGSPVRIDCVSGGTPQNTPFQHVEVGNYGVLLSCYMYVAGRMHVANGARVEQNCGSGNVWVLDTLTTDAGSIIGNGAGYPGSNQLGVVFGDSSGTAAINGAYTPHWSYFTALHARMRSGLGYHNVRIDRSTTLADSLTFDGELDIINDGTIFALGGHRLTVRGAMDFSNNSLVRMDNAADTLSVASGDETARFYWDGADNSGLLTNGVVLYAGNSFYGPSFKASGAHRFVFTGTATGAATQVQGTPVFEKMEMRGTRAVSMSDHATVQDTLLISTASQLTGSNYVVIGGGGAGALVTVAGSDVAMPGVYLDGPGGTRGVHGRFRPATTYFRAGTPTSDAFQPGLEYGSVHFQGPYRLTQSMPIYGSLVVETGTGALNFNGFRLNVPGDVDVNSGASIQMSTPGDSLLAGGHFNLNSDAGISSVSAGVITVAGDYFYLQRAGSGFSGTSKVLLNGSGGGNQDIYLYTSDGQHDVRNLEIASARTVRFVSAAEVSGNVSITQPTNVQVNSGLLRVGGILSSVSGSVLTANSNLELTDATGTSQLLGGYRSTATTRFLAAGAVIGTRNAATDSIGYRAVDVTSSASTTSDALKISGGLLLSTASSSLTLPTGSAVAGDVDVYGSLTFAGAGIGGGYLYVRPGATATASSSVDAVDFVNIYLYNSTSTLNNPGGSPSTGFRYKSPGGNFYQNGGTVNGPTPYVWP